MLTGTIDICQTFLCLINSALHDANTASPLQRSPGDLRQTKPKKRKTHQDKQEYLPLGSILAQAIKHFYCKHQLNPPL